MRHQTHVVEKKRSAPALFKHCPVWALIFACGVVGAGYACIMNMENGLHLEYVTLQQELAELEAKQNTYQYILAKRRVVDPSVITHNWEYPEIMPVVEVEQNRHSDALAVR